MPIFKLRSWATPTLYDCKDYEVTADTLQAAIELLSKLPEQVDDLPSDRVNIDHDAVHAIDYARGADDAVTSLDPQEIVGGDSGISFINDDGTCGGDAGVIVGPEGRAMPRVTLTTRALGLTEGEAKTLCFLLETGAMSEMSNAWRGNAQRILRRLEVSIDEPNIRRILDVSTAHLTADEMDMLGCGELPGQRFVDEHGGLVAAYSYDLTQNDGPPDGAGAHLTRIMNRALARHCTFVQFDTDGPELPGFRTFARED